jgi:hypothetical protein
MNIKLHRAVLFSFITVLISDIFEYMGIVGVGDINFASVTAILKVISLYSLIFYIRKCNWGKQIPVRALRIFKGLIFWNILTIIRGALNAKDYWDWRFLGLSSFFYFLIPYAMVIGVMFFSNAPFFRFAYKRIYTFAAVLIPFTFIGVFLYAKAVTSVWFYTLLSIYIPKRRRLLIFATAFLAVVTCYEVRANVLRIIVAVCLFFAYYFRRFIRISYLKIVCFLFFITPLIFLSLGVSGYFNVFQPFDEDEQFVIAEGGKESSNLIQDTRTGLYVEVLSSVLENNALIFGGGATAKYKSDMFITIDDGRGRYGAEVGFLNTLLYAGAVGVLFYFFILLTASYYAISHSNNFFSKILGVFVAFRWLLFFIEDVTKYDLNFYFLWIAIGMCFSTQFRMQTDDDLKRWLAKNIVRR